MLANLKAAIEKKKREANTSKTAHQPTLKQNIPRSVCSNKQQERAEDAEEQRARAALERKAKRYQDLEQGRSELVPAGALIDFEQKLRKRIKYEDEEDEADDDNKRSRSLVSIAPPASLIGSSASSSVMINDAVEDILSSIRMTPNSKTNSKGNSTLTRESKVD